MTTDASALPQREILPGMLALLGGKGGCGCTLVAAELAARASSAVPTALVDLDAPGGDLGALLPEWPVQGGVEACLARIDQLDADLVRGLASPLAPGLHLLAQPLELAAAVEPAVSEVHRLLEAAAGAWRRVVVDCGSRPSPAGVSALLRAERVLTVVRPQVSSLRGASRQLELLLGQGLAAERVGLVVNQHGEEGLDPAECAEYLGVSLAAVLPLDRDARRRYEERGALTGLEGARGRLGKALDRLAGGLQLSAVPPRWWQRVHSKTGTKADG